MASLARRTAITVNESFVNYCVSASASLFVTWNTQRILVFTTYGRFVGDISLGSPVRSVSVNAGGDMICAVTDHGYSMMSPEGVVSWRGEWVSPHHGLRASLFLGDGSRVVVLGEGGLQQFDSSTGTLLSELVDLPFQASDVVLVRHPEAEVVGIWSSGGPGTLMIHWCICDPQPLSLFEQPMVQHTGIPSFHPAGGEFLVLTEGDTLNRCTFPSGNIIGTIDVKSVIHDLGDFGVDSLGDSACYLSDQDALVTTSEGMLYRVDFRAERTVDELVPLKEDGNQQERLPVFNLGLSYSAGLLFTFSPMGTDSVFSIWDVSLLTGAFAVPLVGRPYSLRLREEGHLFRGAK